MDNLRPFIIKKVDLYSYTYIPSSSIVIFAKFNQEKVNFDITSFALFKIIRYINGEESTV